MENFLETLIKDILISHCPQKFATELKNAEDLDDVIMKITKKFKEKTNHVWGANIAAFRRVADAMIEQGIIK